MTTAAPYDPIQPVFEAAKQEFRAELNDDALFAEILKTTTVDDVYDYTESLQQDQRSANRLRNLTKIKPCLERLQDYADVIQVFMQAKPEILALIWGPIKLLLQLTNAVRESFDAILDVTAEVGTLLPEFQETIKLFPNNGSIKDILALFFKDMLDFYIIALKFFRLSRWKIMFESMWPIHRKKIRVIKGHIERHTLLLRNGARLQHLQEEDAARRLALDHYETTERFHQRQEYLSIKADVNPRSFEERLGWFQNRSCKGTGKWLLQDPLFIKWLNTSDTPNILWLQGIPGAGKTFLSSAAIHETMGRPGRGHTLFAFLSYMHENSALATIHSLLFQLTSQDESLQTLLSQSSRGRFKSDVHVAVKVFEMILNCAGTTYIVIDGVDEMDEFERGRLLRTLLELSSGCNETKWIFSSRNEADLGRMLKDKAEAIRVDHRNAGNIQAFVNETLQDWFGTRMFLPDSRTEIERLLAPLAAKAKGMFLYAKIVLDSIKDLELDEICDELHVLPESLNAAYKRAFDRINNYKIPTLKEKARKLLGWIGCSKILMTSQELQQALTLGTEGTGTRRVTRPSVSLDVIRICGPIVEVVDEYVQFVHFTVKEYLFSPNIPESINESEATLSLAISCITYLRRDHHEPGASVERAHTNLIRGVYRLHNYATIMWLPLVEHFIALGCENTIPDVLINNIDGFILERSNHDYVETSGFATPTSLSPFGPWPEIYNFLSKYAHFHSSWSNTEWLKWQDSKWENNDPTTMSKVARRVSEDLDRVLCETSQHQLNCDCALIREYHGQRPFKCIFPPCSFHRYGFESMARRNRHVELHEKPWKCKFPGCEYENGGFLSRKMRDDHLNRFHQEKDHVPTVKTISVEDADELQPLLFDLVRADQVEAVKALFSQYILLGDVEKEELVKLAARSSSCMMLEILFPALLDKSYITSELDKYSARVFGKSLGSRMRYNERLSYLENCLKSAIEGGNVAVFKHIIQLVEETATLQGYEKTWAAEACACFVSSVLEAESDELLGEWMKYFVQAVELDGTENRPHDAMDRTVVNATSKTVITAALRSAKKEEFLMAIWKRAGENTKTWWDRHELRKIYFILQNHSQEGFRPSPRLVEFLLEAGVAADDRPQEKYPTLLQSLTRQDSRNAAECMKLLLAYGADLDLKERHAQKSLRERKGPKNISKWLGITWDELVRQTKKERQSHQLVDKTTWDSLTSTM